MWDSSSTEALFLSIRVASAATLFMILVGVPISFWLARNRKPISYALNGVLLLPLVIPPVVTGYILLVAFSPSGFIGSALETVGIRLALDWKGAVVASAVVAFPLFLTVARVAFEKCDLRLESVATTLKAGPVRVFRTIILPQALPGLAAASAVAFGEFGATMTLAGNIPGQTRTVPQAVYSLFLAGHDKGAWGLIIVSLLVGLAAIAVSQILVSRPRPEGIK
jgi:molybdate transport system permease protein